MPAALCNHLMFMLSLTKRANKSNGPEPLTKRVIVIRDAPSGEGIGHCERLKSRVFEVSQNPHEFFDDYFKRRS
jgi:hypothetical protein